MTKVTPSTQKVQMEPCAGNHGQSQRYCLSWGFPGGLVIKNLPPVQETQEMRVRSLGWEDPMEEEMATHSSILAWGIPGTEEPGGLQFMGLQKVKQDLVTAHAHIAYYTTVLGILCPFSFLSPHRTKVPSPLGVGRGDLILQINQLWEVMCFASRLRQ